MAISAPLNHGLEIGRRALRAQQTGLNITGHNIANANTEGYSRQRVEVVNASSGQGGVGSGADATNISRQRSRLLDLQVRNEQQALGRWNAIEQSLGGIEAIFNESAGAGASEAGAVFEEPLGPGLNSSLDRFWNSWQDVANAPDSLAARSALRQEGDFLASTLRQLHDQLNQTQIQLDGQIVEQVEVVNGILDQVAQLNSEISKAGFAGGITADLADQRDRLIEELADLVQVDVIERGEAGQVALVVGGHTLVERDRAVHLDLRRHSADGLSRAQIVFSDDRRQASLGGGQLSGLVEVRDGQVPEWIGQLNELATGLAQGVNDLHRRGFGLDGGSGVDFFVGDSAADFALSDQVAADVAAIAVSADGNRGDNGIGLAIGALRDEALLDGGTTSVGEFYRGLLGDIGARSQRAQTAAENHRLFAAQLDNRRQSVQGVSLNEEAAQLVLYQRAYQAAARTVSIVDQLLEVTVNL